MSPASVEHILNTIDVETLTAKTVWEKRANTGRKSLSQSVNDFKKLTEDEHTLMNGAVTKIMKKGF